MTVHAWLFWRVHSLCGVWKCCEWILDERNKASFSLNFKPSMSGNEFDYTQRYCDYDEDTPGMTSEKLLMMSGF